MEEQLINNQTDRETVRRVLGGDVTAFGALVERHHRPLFGFLFRLLFNRQDTEDLVQETFFTAYRELQRFDPGRNFKTWLFTIGRRLAISQLRHRKVVYDALPEIALDPLAREDAGDVAVMRVETRRELDAALAELPPTYRQAVWLFHVEQLPVAEIARVLGKNSLSTRVLLHRARNALRQRMANREKTAVAALNTPSRNPTLVTGGN